MKFQLELIYYTNLSGKAAGVYALIPECVSSESRLSEDRLTKTLVMAERKPLYAKILSSCPYVHMG